MLKQLLLIFLLTIFCSCSFTIAQEESGNEKEKHSNSRNSSKSNQTTMWKLKNSEARKSGIKYVR